MRNVTLKGIFAHKPRLVLTCLAIVIGVTFVSGTYVLTDTLHNTFYSLFGTIFHKIDFQVRGVAQFPTDAATAVRNPIPEALVDRIPPGARGRGRRWRGRRLRPVRLARREAHRHRRRAHHRGELRPRPAHLRAAHRAGPPAHGAP